MTTATVLIVTSAGEIRVSVDLDRAPITSKNFLDYGRSRDRRGFAAFGRVSHGMDVVRTIHAGHAEGQLLEPPFAILTASIVHVS